MPLDFSELLPPRSVFLQGRKYFLSRECATEPDILKQIRLNQIFNDIRAEIGPSGITGGLILASPQRDAAR
jgi:hypothetical protein